MGKVESYFNVAGYFEKSTKALRLKACMVSI